VHEPMDEAKRDDRLEGGEPRPLGGERPQRVEGRTEVPPAGLVEEEERRRGRVVALEGLEAGGRLADAPPPRRRDAFRRRDGGRDLPGALLGADLRRRIRLARGEERVDERADTPPVLARRVD